MALLLLTGKINGATFWIGEYGWFGDPATDAA
jgi:hypothetical protein